MSRLGSRFKQLEKRVVEENANEPSALMFLPSKGRDHHLPGIWINVVTGQVMSDEEYRLLE